MSYRITLAKMRKRFLRNEDGDAPIEAAIMIPMIFLVMICILTLLDLVRQHGMHQRAAYTIGDMISRETLPLDAEYLTGTHNLLNALTRTPQDSTVRVSIVRYDDQDEVFKLDWSKTSGAAVPMTDAGVRDWSEKLPMMVHNERMIVVETFANYVPPFNIGLGKQEVDHFVFTRPRYAPQVLWVDLEDPEFAGS